MKMKQISLRAKIFFVLVFLVLLTLVGGTVTMLSVYRMSVLLNSAIETGVAALSVAHALETSLSLQRGLLTYYYEDGNIEWLQQLDQNHKAFHECLKKARESAYLSKQFDVLSEIESKYIRYSYSRDQVIGLYKAGQTEAGFSLHRGLRGEFVELAELCERYRQLHQQRIEWARSEIALRVRHLKVLSMVAIPSALVLGAMLLYILIRQVLGPLRKLAMGSGPEVKNGRVIDEVKALSQRVHDLIQDVDQTQSELQQSREHLVQSEKLAMVGKLAAGVAHSIRNPLTSVKMRLFSMQRTLDLTPTQKEDIEVISDEIRHIDTIVRNFLEFSRPPKLKLQRVSPSDVVDMAVQLLKHRLESYGVELELYRQRPLSEIEGDPEQLKEVLVNLMVNACEAMGEGGKILIQEEEGVTRPMGEVCVVRVSDNGPGIPESVGEKIFQPFFSTKEEGTGLGLSIAARIIEDHRGCLKFRSRAGKGTTFTITLPSRGDRSWLRS
jgi:signal transduction histidine kinase